MKKILLCLIFLIILIGAAYSQTEKNGNCAERLKTLIATSVNFNNPFKKELSAAISENTGNNYTIQLYVYDSGENSKNTVGWITLDAANNLLADITDDPGGGVVLRYNPALFNEYLSDCLNIKTPALKNNRTAGNEKLKTGVLPFDFDEYYGACYNFPHTDKCEENYPIYTLSQASRLSKIIKNTYAAAEYMYLPEIQNYQVVVLFNTETDIETYVLLVIDKDKIISSLEIGKMSETSIMDFNISKDYLITLYTRKSDKDKREKWKSFKIDSGGKIIKI